MKNQQQVSTPPFIQLGTNAYSIFNTAEISTISRFSVDITEDNREQNKGFITPDGQVYVIRISLKGGIQREIKCSSLESWNNAFMELSTVLNTHVILPS
ncbi:hypothetical protein [Hymenobacter sp. YC55]|uniref:hypothetical protein n=1 Tax=Hymenobacter sp. YC55 TaxID=3034019 RepID=UPI0023FA33E2|nr:hypothetical protein [Hymenobacter sp. YC55]MDF7810919.1 hypothetical protein [Hymenobacter sp. YC55]